MIIITIRGITADYMKRRDKKKKNKATAALTEPANERRLVTTVTIIERLKRTHRIYRCVCVCYAIQQIAACICWRYEACSMPISLGRTVSASSTHKCYCAGPDFPFYFSGGCCCCFFRMACGKSHRNQPDLPGQYNNTLQQQTIANVRVFCLLLLEISPHSGNRRCSPQPIHLCAVCVCA